MSPFARQVVGGQARRRPWPPHPLGEPLLSRCRPASQDVCPIFIITIRFYTARPIN